MTLPETNIPSAIDDGKLEFDYRCKYNITFIIFLRKLYKGLVIFRGLFRTNKIPHIKCTTVCHISRDNINFSLKSNEALNFLSCRTSYSNIVS